MVPLVVLALGGPTSGVAGDAFSLQISGGPQGSRTPDLRRAKARELIPDSHRKYQGITDLQRFLGVGFPDHPTA